MPSSKAVRLRGLPRTLHRWIAIGSMVLLIPISLSGALLVWRDTLDAMINPARYAITGANVALPPSAYLGHATAAFERGLRPTVIRFPAEPGLPVTVMARGAPRSEGGPPRVVTVYLDPPSGRVLDVVDFRASFMGLLHRFHENLTVPDYSGRQIVGWAGVGMLVLSLTGLWLWWPRNSALRFGLRWRRSPAITANLHHLVGFWISLPLAIVSASGIYLAFPQTARNAMSAVAAMNPQGPRPGAQVAREIAMTPDQALAAAHASEADARLAAARPAAIFLPVPDAREGASPLWRIQLRQAAGGDVTVTVEDRTGAARRAPDPLAGDRAAQLIRWVHEGSYGGPVWRLVVGLCGIMPSALGLTGIVIWLRGRRRRKAAERLNELPQFEAAE